MVIGGSTYGARSVPGLRAGVVPTSERVPADGSIRVFCGGHQLNLALDELSTDDADFLHLLTKMISNRRRQRVKEQVPSVR